jgi:SpoVK/Ycf46/Vps4 family AAA+-type ATPase
MLPKLQDLHDRGQVLFFICTNHVDMMDSAVVRGGRMDHRIGVPSPDHGARAHILEELTKDVRGVEHLESAVKLLTELSERFNRSELKRAVLKLLEGAKLSPWSSAAEADEAVRHVVTTMSDSLTITTAMRDEFKEHQAKWSDPVLLGAR